MLEVVPKLLVGIPVGRKPGTMEDAIPFCLAPEEVGAKAKESTKTYSLTWIPSAKDRNTNPDLSADVSAEGLLL